jgi:rod shape-determining protein MreC
VSERRNLWILVAILVAELTLLASQVPGQSGGSLLEEVSLRLVAPAPKLVSRLAEPLKRTGAGLRRREELEETNWQLEQRVQTLEEELFRLRKVEEDRARLAAVVGYTPPTPAQLQPVEVVYADHTSWLRTLIVYTGVEPARLDQPVVTLEGLVGRVVMVSGRYAKVQLVTDRAAAVSAILERTRRQATVRGDLEGLVLEYLPLQAGVHPGDVLLTSGLDRIYPRGLKIGTVVEVQASAGGGLFYEVKVVPAVDFSLLDQVFLVQTEIVPPVLIEQVPSGIP